MPTSTRETERARRSIPGESSAWVPYMLLVIFVLLWGYKPMQAELQQRQHR